MLEGLQSKLPILIGDKYLVRYIDDGDIEDIFDIYSNEKISKHIVRKVHTTLNDSKQLIQLLKDRMVEGDNVYLGICESKTNKLIGIIRFLIKEDPQVITLGYGLNEKYWGQGIVPKVIDELICYIKSDNKYLKLRATIKPDNINSLRCLEKLRFKKSGEFMKVGIVDNEEVKTKRFLYYKKL
ncbi:GNAT family N-acetyltransferase [Clostridium sp. D2Q-11]|uniref:GNAT family N-acetyltransferase n=1 Tax=Anaeromonas frigoriresistens TaxID=2683708 RepID=A0A942UVG9_9FIRM|nr:GNAT family N-acetyltransferase [Anaeromonas frigoriresistens]MBS4537641.1 GNAT family N-acetyltransferase [Anaeromonas frigoriresistens]